MTDSIHNEGATSADLKRTKRVRRPQAAASAIDRLPPASPEAEQGVLGCCLMEPQTCIAEAVGVLQFEGFYDLRNQSIWDELVEMWDEKVGIDVITLQQRLKDKELLEQVGGIAYLSSLPNVVPSAANLSYYLEIVKEKYVLRRLIGTCTDVVGRVYEHEGTTDELVDEVEHDLGKISKLHAGEDEKPIKTLVTAAIDKIELLHANQGALLGVSTGLVDIDRMTGGLKGGEVFVIAGRPGTGKSSLGMQIAEHVAVELKLPVGVFSLEMMAEALVLRVLCSRSRVNLRQLAQRGLLTESDFPKITGQAGLINKAPLHIDDSSGLSILRLKAKARRMAQRNGIKLFVIDYLQLLHTTNKKADNRQQEIADVSIGCKDLAKELNVPIIVLAQLNRESEKNKRKPKISDLRESGQIEQDADVIGLLFPQDETSEDDAPRSYDNGFPVGLSIAKNRDGETGEIDLLFRKHITRFECVSKFSDEDVSSPYRDN